MITLTVLIEEKEDGTLSVGCNPSPGAYTEAEETVAQEISDGIKQVIARLETVTRTTH